MHSVRAAGALLVLLVAVGVSPGSAQAAPASESRATAWCSGAVSWQTAARRVGSVVRVKARVASGVFARSSNGRPTFLNLGNAYPNPSRLTVIIWGRNRSRFPRAPEAMFRPGTVVCVQGLVETYRGVAEIESRRWDAQARVLR